MNLKSIISVLSPTSFWRFENFSVDNVYDEYNNNTLVNYGATLDQDGSNNTNLSDKSVNLNGGYLDTNPEIINTELSTNELFVSFNFRCPEEIIGTKPILSKWHPNQIFFLGFENGVLVLKVRTDTDLLEVNMTNKDVLYNNRWNNCVVKIWNGTIRLDVNGTSQREHGSYIIPVTGNIYTDTTSPFRIGGEGSESFTQDFFLTDLAITKAQNNDVNGLYTLTRDREDRYLDLAPDYYFNITEAILANTTGAVTNKGTKGSHIKGYLKGNDISTFALRNDSKEQSSMQMVEFINGSYFTIDDILTCDFTGDQTTSVLMGISHSGTNSLTGQTMRLLDLSNTNNIWRFAPFLYASGADTRLYMNVFDENGTEIQSTYNTKAGADYSNMGLITSKGGINGVNESHWTHIQKRESSQLATYPAIVGTYTPPSTQTFENNKFFHIIDWADTHLNPCMGEVALFSRKVTNSEELNLNLPEISVYGYLIGGLHNVSDYGWKSGYTDESEESRRYYSKTGLNFDNTSVGYLTTQNNDTLTNRLNLWNGTTHLVDETDYILTGSSAGIGDLDFVYNYFVKNLNTTDKYRNVRFYYSTTNHIEIFLNQRDGALSLGDIDIVMSGDMTYNFSTTSQKVIDDGYHMITLVRREGVVYELYIDGELEAYGTTSAIHNISTSGYIQHLGGECYLNDMVMLLGTNAFNYKAFIEFIYQGYHQTVTGTTELSNAGIESKLHTIDSGTLLKYQTTLSDANGLFKLVLPKTGDSTGKYIMAVPLDENATPTVVVHGPYQTSNTFDQLVTDPVIGELYDMILDMEPLVYMPFNDTTLPILDHSGNNLDGTMIGNGYTLDQDAMEVNSKAIYFDNNGESWVDLTHDGYMDYTNKGLTFSCWFKQGSVPTNSYWGLFHLGVGDDNTAGTIKLQLSTSAINFNDTNGTNTAITHNVDLNVWTNIVMRIRDDSFDFYINGEYVDSHTPNSSRFNFLAKTYIKFAYSSTSHPVDDTYITQSVLYPYPLSTEDIIKQAQRGFGFNSNTLKSTIEYDVPEVYYTFDRLKTTSDELGNYNLSVNGVIDFSRNSVVINGDVIDNNYLYNDNYKINATDNGGTIEFSFKTKNDTQRYYDTVANHPPFIYFRLDETSGTTAYSDQSGKIDNGVISENVLINQPTLIVDQVGSSMYFDGTTHEGINIGDPGTDAISTMSFSALVKFEDFGTTQIIFKEGGSGNGWAIGVYNGNLEVGTKGDEIHFGYDTANLELNRTYHIVMVLDGTLDEGKIYIDGVLVLDETHAIGTHNGSSNCMIGSTDPADLQSPMTGDAVSLQAFKGYIDEVVVFSTQLSQTEVTELYNSSINATFYSNSVLLSEWDNSTSDGTYKFTLEDSGLVRCYLVDDETWLESSIQYNDGKFHYVNLTIDGNDVELFIDDVSQASITLTPSNALPPELYADKINSLNPTAYWRFDDAIGETIAVEETGNWDGTYVDTPTLESTGLLVGTENGGVELDGILQKITTPYLPPIGNAPRSFVFLINGAEVFTEVETNVLFSYGINELGKKVVCRIAGSDTGDGTYGDIRVESHTGVLMWNTDLKDGNTHHIVVTFEGTTHADFKIYVDGIELTTISYSNATDTIIDTGYEANLTIGMDYWVPDRAFSGIMDDFTVFDYALNDDQINELFSISKGYTTPTSYNEIVMNEIPIAYWRMGELSGNLVDETGKYNAVVTGTPTYGLNGLVKNDVDSAIRFSTDQYALPSYVGNIKSLSVIVNSSDALGWQGIFGNYTTIDDRFGIVIVGEDEYPALFYNQSYASLKGDKVITDGLNHLIVVAYNGTDTEWWIDNVKQSTSYVGNLFDWGTTETIVAGYKHSTGYQSRGTRIIDELAVYDNTLSANTIEQLYKSFLDWDLTNTQTTYKDYITDSLPSAYWRLGETTGVSTAVDETGLYDALYTVTPILEATSLLVGDNNTAVTFSGGEYVTTEYIVPAIENISATLLVNLPNITQTGIFIGDINVGGSNNSSRISFGIEGANWYINMGNDSTSYWTDSHPHSLKPNQTHHIAYTWDGFNFKLYVDGVLDYYGTSTVSMGTQGTIKLHLGVFGDFLDRYLDGTLDEVVIHEFTLSQEQVKEMYLLSVANTNTPTNYSEQVKSLMPRSYWRLGDSVGTTAVDEMGYYDGTYTGGYTLGQTGLVTNDVDYCVLLDGTTGYVDIPTTDAIIDFSKSFTVSVLLDFDDLTFTNNQYQCMISLKTTGLDPFLITLSNNVNFANISYGVRDNIIEKIAVDLSNPINIVVKWDGNVYTSYIDGIIKDVTTASNFGSVTNRSIIGAYEYTGSYDAFTGKLDEVSVYNYALSNTDVSNLHQFYLDSGNAVFESAYGSEVLALEPIAYYRLGADGDRIVDEMGNYDGYSTNNPINVDGLLVDDLNPAMYFDNTNKRVNLPKSIFEDQTSSMSVSGIANINWSSTYDVLFIFSDSDAEPQFRVFSYTLGELYFYIKQGGVSNFVTVSAPSGNFHWCAVYDAEKDTAKLYINGVLGGEVATEPFVSWASTASEIVMGHTPSWYGADATDGTLDETAIFNKVLTDDEILGLYKTSIVFNENALSYQEHLNNYQPIAYYKLDEPSGLIATDSSINNNDASYNGTPIQYVDGLLKGVSNKTMFFDGVNDYVGIPHFSEMNSTSQTISFLFKSSHTLDASYKGIVHRAPTASNTVTDFFIRIEATTGYLVYRIAEAGGSISDITTDFNVHDGKTRHIVAVKEANGANDKTYLYIDGVLYGTNETSGWHTQSITNEIVLGKLSSVSDADRYFNGYIDKFALFDKAIDADAVRSLYNASKSPKAIETYKDLVLSNAPIAYYRFNETGTTDISDSFVGTDGADIDTNLWSVNPSELSVIGSAKILNNKMHLTNRGTTSTTYEKTTILGTHRLSGDFDIEVSFSDLVHLNHESHAFRLYIKALTHTLYVATSYTSGSGYEIKSVASGSTSSSSNITITELYGKLRLTRVGTVGTTYYKEGIDANWTLVDTCTMETDDVFYEVVLTDYDDSTDETSVNVYDFIMNVGTPVEPVIAIDEMGYYDGTYISSPVLNNTGLVVNETQSSVRFDASATGQRLDLGNSLTGIRTINLLYKPTITRNDSSTQYEAILGRYSGSDNDNEYLLVFYPNSGVLRFQHNDNIGTQYFINSNQSEWLAGITYNIAIVIDPVDGLLMYVNGVLQTDTNNGITTAYATDAEELAIGSWSDYTGDNRTTKANLDEVSIYNYALSQDQIKELYYKSSNSTNLDAFDIVIDHSKVDEDLYDFPILVNLGGDSGINNISTTKIFNELYLPDNTPHRYWRIVATGNNGGIYVAIDEIEFRAVVDGVDQTVPQASGSLVTASSYVNTSNYPYFAFDNQQLANQWVSASITQGSINEWIKYDTNGLGDISAVELSIRATTNAGQQENLLRDFTVEFSDDDVNWTEVANIIGETNWASGEVRTFKLGISQTEKLTAYYKNPNENTYNSYDIEINALSPVGYWRFGEILGIDAIDETATQNGTYINSPILTDNSLLYGDTDSAVTLNGSTQNIDIPHNAVYNSNDQSFTFIFVAPSSIPTDSKGLVYKAPDTGFDREMGIAVNANDGVLKYNIFDGVSQTDGIVTSQESICDGLVHHVVAIKKYALNNDTLQLYIDGVLVDEMIVGYNAVQNTNEIVVGKVASNSISARYYSGTIDEFAIFNSVLTPEQVWTLYQTSISANASDVTIETQQCKVEIDRWDQINKEAQLWIKVPYISKDTDTTINLSYNQNNDDNSHNIGYTGSAQAKEVWTEYDYVYHLSNAKGFDSTQYTNDGTPISIDSSNIVDFGIGKGIAVDGINDWYELGDIPNLGLRDYHLNIKFQLNTTVPSWQIMFCDGNGVVGNGLMYISVKAGGILNFYFNTGSGVDFNFATPIVVDTEYNVSIFVDRDGFLYAYVNGVLDANSSDISGTSAIDVVTANDAFIGKYKLTQYPVDGIMKELRIQYKLPSVGWISTNLISNQDSLVNYEVATSYIEPYVPPTSGTGLLEYGNHRFTIGSDATGDANARLDNKTWIDDLAIYGKVLTPVRQTEHYTKFVDKKEFMINDI